MSEEKKFVARNLQVLTPENTPEWIIGNEGLESLWDGVLFQLSVNEKMRADGHPVPKLVELNKAEYDNMPDVHKALEVISGCLAAYFASMSAILSAEAFGKIISPLPDVLGQALYQVGLMAPLSREETEASIERVDKKATEIKKKMNTKADDHPAVKKVIEDFDSEDSLTKAINQLKNIGKGLIH